MAAADAAFVLRVRRDQVARGRGEQLPGRTFSAPRKWMKGKGRITIQYGVCYSYAFPQVSASVLLLPLA